MGGRAAEELKFNSVTTGAANDIEQATKIAKAMVTMYGMSDRFGMVQMEETTGQYLDNRSYYNCSDRTAAMVDEEIRLIVKRCYDKAIMLLKKNEKILDAVAAFLVEHETITGEEFMDIFNKITANQKAVYEVDDASGKYPVRRNSYSVSVSDKKLSDEEAKALKKAEKKAEKKAKKEKDKDKKDKGLKAILKGVKGKDKYKAYKQYEASDEYYGKFSMGDDEDDEDDVPVNPLIGKNSAGQSSDRRDSVISRNDNAGSNNISFETDNRSNIDKNSMYKTPTEEKTTGAYHSVNAYYPAPKEEAPSEAEQISEVSTDVEDPLAEADNSSSEERVAMPWENYQSAEEKRAEAEEETEDNEE